MDFYMYHGRTTPDGPPQQLDDKGVPSDVDDWGFEGPRLHGVIGFHCTYGVSGTWTLWFDSKESADEAAAMTGWDRWDETSLEVRFSTDETLVVIRDPRYDRLHYFGDWGIK